MDININFFYIIKDNISFFYLMKSQKFLIIYKYIVNLRFIILFEI